MICPRCKNPMRDGFIHAANRIAWSPERWKSSIEPSMHKGAVVLSKQSRMHINYVRSFLCEECESVVIDYSTDE